MRSGRRLPVFLAFLIALALLLAPAIASGKIVRHERSAGDARQPLGSIAGERYPPRDLIRKAPTAAGSGASSAGRPGHVDGRAPRSAGPAARGSKFGLFDSNAVDATESYPNSTNGKVFGRIDGIGRYSCSATVVHAKNRSVIFTAGHCVHDPDAGWASEFIFAPSYNRGQTPYGVWDWEVMYAPRQWVRKGNINYDYAAVVLGRSAGRKIEPTVGSLGFAYNVPPKRKSYRAVGYPFNKFDTEVMWQCHSGFGGFDPFRRPPGTAPIGIGCDMLGGSSGGGWSIAGDRLASVTSFGYDNRPGELYGPQLTKSANKLRRAAGREKVG